MAFQVIWATASGKNKAVLDTPDRDLSLHLDCSLSWPMLPAFGYTLLREEASPLTSLKEKQTEFFVRKTHKLLHVGGNILG